jgi:hypothetical protein
VLVSIGVPADTPGVATDVQPTGDPIAYDTGRYLGTPWASGFGRTFNETVTVPASGMATVVFNQWTKEGVAQASPGPFY